MCKGIKKKKRAFWWESEMEHEAYETAMPQAHTIIFQFPWQSSVIVPTIFSAEKKSVKLLPIYLGIYCIRVEHVLLTAKNLVGWKHCSL